MTVKAGSLVAVCLVLVVTACGGTAHPSRAASAATGGLPGGSPPPPAPALPAEGAASPLAVDPEWGGQPNGLQPADPMSRAPRVLAAGDNVLVTALVKNSTEYQLPNRGGEGQNGPAETESFQIDVFVATRGPPSGFGNTVDVPPAAWPGVIWDYANAHGATRSINVSPGAKTARVEFVWQHTNQNGTHVAPGVYWAVLRVTGSPRAGDNGDQYWPIQVTG